MEKSGGESREIIFSARVLEDLSSRSSSQAVSSRKQQGPDIRAGSYHVIDLLSGSCGVLKVAFVPKQGKIFCSGRVWYASLYDFSCQTQSQPDAVIGVSRYFQTSAASP